MDERKLAIAHKDSRRGVGRSSCTPATAMMISALASPA